MQHRAGIPIAALGLTFTSACAEPRISAVGLWEAFQVLSYGDDVTDSYVYSIENGDCTYERGVSLLITQRPAALWTYEYTYRCGDVVYSYNPGAYLPIQGTQREFTLIDQYSEPAVRCTPFDPELHCIQAEFGLEFRFRKVDDP